MRPLAGEKIENNGCDTGHKVYEYSDYKDKKGCVRWEYENQDSDRSKSYIANNSLDPQLYTLREYKPQYMANPSSSFASSTKGISPIMYSLLI